MGKLSLYTALGGVRPSAVSVENRLVSISISISEIAES